MRAAHLRWMKIALLMALLPQHLAARSLGLGDITSIDPLGYECIPAKYFEEDAPDIAAAAFQVGGKVRLARTCLPEPCEGAVERVELASLTGTDMASLRFQREWDEYYARYADYCRRETTPITDDVATDDDGFWAGVLENPMTQVVALTAGTRLTTGNLQTASIVRTGTTSNFTLPPLRVLGRTVTQTVTTTDSDGSGTSDESSEVVTDTLGDDSEKDIAVVPLSSSALFLLIALMLLAAYRSSLFRDTAQV